MDLLKTLGMKPNSTEGSANAGSTSTVSNPTTGSEGKVAGDASAVVSTKSASAATGQANTAEGTSNTATSDKGEPNGSSVSDPNTWTIDSAFAEIKKLREENKARRQKYEESLEIMKKDSEIRINAFQSELEKAKEAQRKLDELQEKEADKKRSLEERLSNRETRMIELEQRNKQIEAAYQAKLRESEVQLQALQAEQQAEQEVYKQRLDKELGSVPAKFQDMAKLLVKGAGDNRDALVALNEAKLQGLFDDKQIVVSHAVPGASQGARATQESLDESEKARRARLSAQQKIGAALKEIRGGNPNSAFRLNNK